MSDEGKTDKKQEHTQKRCHAGADPGVRCGNHREASVLQRNWEGTSDGVGSGPLRRGHRRVLGDDKSDKCVWRSRPEVGAQHGGR